MTSRLRSMSSGDRSLIVGQSCKPQHSGSLQPVSASSKSRICLWTGGRRSKLDLCISGPDSTATSFFDPVQYELRLYCFSTELYWFLGVISDARTTDEQDSAVSAGTDQYVSAWETEEKWDQGSSQSLEGWISQSRLCRDSQSAALSAQCKPCLVTGLSQNSSADSGKGLEKLQSNPCFRQFRLLEFQ